MAALTERRWPSLWSGWFARPLPSLVSPPLTAGVGPEDVSADYTDGILEVRLPLREAGPGPARVPVTRGGSSE